MKKQLYRSRKNRIVGGVAGGLAEYFDIDPVLIRAAFVITFLGWGFGLLAYIVLWIIVPSVEKLYIEEVEEKPEPPKEKISPEVLEKRRAGRRNIAAVILIFIGAIWLLDNYIPNIYFCDLWPLALVALGLLILFKPNIFHNNNTENAK